MGQKIHPYGFRLGVNKPWRSRWFATRDYAKLLVEDVKLKAELKDKLKAAGVSSVEIERPGNKLRFLIRTARGRMVTRTAYLHFGIKPPERASATLQLFEDPR